MPTIEGNAAAYFIDRHADKDYRNKPAFIEALTGKEISYAALAAETGKMASLYERNGIRPEDRAAMIVLDRIEVPVIFWGAGVEPGLIRGPAATVDIAPTLAREIGVEVPGGLAGEPLPLRARGE